MQNFYSNEDIHEEVQGYEQVYQWAVQNGAKIAYLGNQQQWVCKFNSQYVGVRAHQDIPPNTAYMAIPSKLIISVNKVKYGELQPIFHDHPQIFKGQEGQFNMLTIYILKENQLGDKSFYWPYLKTIQNVETLLDWSDQQLKELGNESISEQKRYLQRNLKENYFYMLKEKVFEQLKIDVDFKKFKWANTVVMTRCYGWSLPSTSIIPIADMLNHSSHNNTTHYMVSLQQQRKHNNVLYIKKSKKINLGILDKDLKQQFQDRIDKKREKENQSETKEIWEFDFSDYSDQEDNDSDQQQKLIRKQSMKNMTQKDLLKLNKNKAKPIIVQSTTPVIIDKECNSSEELDDQNNWEWYDEQSLDNCYFIMCTEEGKKKGEQIFNCYGKRTNQFLLMWYGFCIKQNPYDSLAFRLHPNEIPLTKLVKRILFYGRVQQNEQLKREYTKQIRLKSQRICDDLIYFLSQISDKSVLISLPINLDFEKLVLNFYKSIILEINQNLPQKARIQNPIHASFANILLNGHRLILQKNLIYVQSALELVQSLERYPLKVTYRKKSMEVKKALRQYLKQLYKSEQHRV